MKIRVNQSGKLKLKIFKGSTSTDLTSSQQDIEPELLNTIVGFWGALLFGWCSSMVSMSLFLKNVPALFCPAKDPLLASNLEVPPGRNHPALPG